MKIKILTNSQETMNQAKLLLSSCDISHGFSFGGSEDFDVKSENSWAGKIFQSIDNLVSKFSPLDNQQKDVGKMIIRSSERLNRYLEDHENDYLKNSSLFIHAESPTNKSVRGIINEFIKLMPKPNILVTPQSTNLKKIFAGIQFHQPSAYLDSRRIVMNTASFDADKNIKAIPQLLSDKYGTQTSVDFTMLHEFAHISQDINDDLLGNSNDPKTIRFIKTISELAHNKKTLEDFNQQVIDINNFFFESSINKSYGYIDHDFVSQLAILQREIYADVGAILHMRNISIQDKDYDTKKQLSFIDDIIEFRQQEQDFCGKRNSHYNEIFDHFTSPGVEYLQTIIKDYGDRELTQEEIHDISNMCIQKGMAKVIVTSNFCSEQSSSQLATLFNTDRKYDEHADKHVLILSSANETNTPLEELRFVKSLSYFQKIAGKEFSSKVTKAYDDIISLDQTRTVKSRLIWQSALHPKLYKEAREEIDFFNSIDEDEYLKSSHLVKITNNRSKFNFNSTTKHPKP